MAQGWYPLTLQPEQIGGVGSISGRTPPLERHEGPRNRLDLLFFSLGAEQRNFTFIFRVYFIGANSENGRLGRLGISVDCVPNSEKGRFGRFGRPAEPAPTGGRFGRLWRNSRFYLRNYEDEANLHVLLW